jgi:para-nitrobenzyl esterase
MAQSFSGYITNFVKTGDPNGGGLAAWPSFDRHSSLADGPVFGPAPRAARVKLIERVEDAQIGKPYGVWGASIDEAEISSSQ